MKTKAQKATELAKGQELFAASEGVLLVDFTKVATSDMRELRKELRANGSRLMVLKKRLLSLMFKEKGIDYSAKDMKTQVAAIFASNVESASSSIYKFFAGLEKAKKIEGPKILGGYDMKGGRSMDAAYVTMMGKLPPREALLGQLLGMLAAPIRSFLYVLDQKAKQGAPAASAPVEAAPVVAEPVAAAEPAKAEAAAEPEKAVEPTLEATPEAAAPTSEPAAA
jgi:large subunit ribosomal protein L10